MILISEMDLYQMPSLLKHLQKGPPMTLFQKKLFLLADIRAYTEDVELKKSLWHTLQNVL